MEGDPVWNVIRKLFVYSVVPTVLILLNDHTQVPVAGVTVHQLLAQTDCAAGVTSKPCQSGHMTSLSKTEDGAGQSEHHDPDHDAGALDGLLGLQRDDPHGVADAQVPVHRDTREEEDGAVQVEVEEEANQAAHEVSKHPAISHHVTGHQEGQRQPVHEVCGGQVDHVDQRRIPALGASEGAIQDDGVQRDAEDEGEGVADREEDVLIGLIYAAGWRRRVDRWRR